MWLWFKTDLWTCNCLANCVCKSIFVYILFILIWWLIGSFMGKTSRKIFWCLHNTDVYLVKKTAILRWRFFKKANAVRVIGAHNMEAVSYRKIVLQNKHFHISQAAWGTGGAKMKGLARGVCRSQTEAAQQFTEYKLTTHGLVSRCCPELL